MNIRSISRLIITILLVSSTQIPLARGGSDTYNPSMAYQGKYIPDVLYIRNRNNPKWYRGLNGTYPNGVLCKDALNHFKSEGKWKGHLRRDGSCGSIAEPTDWALGNRLNYEGSSPAR